MCNKNNYICTCASHRISCGGLHKFAKSIFSFVRVLTSCKSKTQAKKNKKMGFVAIAAVLVAFSVSFASCQLDQLDCAFPDNDDFAYVISNALRSGENPTLATIEVLEFNLLCLAASKERGRYRFFSALVKYRCTTTGGSGCPAGIATEQFESQCDNNGKFSHMVIGQTDNTRRSDPIATFVTQNRRDCALCLSPALIAANSGSTLMTDDTTHCVGRFQRSHIHTQCI